MEMASSVNIEKLKLIEEPLKKLEFGEPKSQKAAFELYQLFSFFFEVITEHQTVSFSSLFSRMVFAFVQYDFGRKLLSANHYIRRRYAAVQNSNIVDEDFLSIGVNVMWHNLNVFYEAEIPEFHQELIAVPQLAKTAQKYLRVQRGFIAEVKEEHTEVLKLSFYSEDNQHIVQEVFLRNPDFCRQVLKLLDFIELPIAVSLVDLTMEGDQWYAEALVLKPDFLVGVTSISECFQSQGSHAINALGTKLIPTDSSVHLLMGNVVNYVFDELIHRPDYSFSDLINDVFKKFALDFAGMHDQDLRSFLEKLKVHFTNLKRIINKELRQTDMSPELSFLEPSFYSIDYGIQGRLDLYHFNPEKKQSDILELKSGKLFRANSYGLNENHYTQTLLYDLLIESVHEGKVKSNNYILYSYLDSANLKFAPRVRQRQLNALYLRNDIILIEEILGGTDDQQIQKLIAYIDPERIPEGFNFLARDARVFKSVYSSLNDIEKKYYRLFISFINREYQLSKTGVHGINGQNGLASLWLDSVEEKKEKFMILSHLSIVKNDAAADNPIIHLGFTEKSSTLSRFRKGDIAVLYPHSDNPRSVLAHQIFKCSILDIDHEGVKLRLRARQKNDELFKNFDLWHIESDNLDSGFIKQFEGMFKFISASPDFRRIIMALDPPGRNQKQPEYTNQVLNKQQAQIIRKAIAAEDYFLLWGPPGTGKTSVMLNALVDYYYNHTDLQILLLAYTNKAVDEICHAIDALVEKDYLRIGSRYATEQAFQDRLLVNQMDNLNTREELVQMLKSYRIVVSTVSSFTGKQAIMNMKKFDLVIIDEASQILEPMLVGLLSLFEKFILIGDHKQLPAVVAQEDRLSQVGDDDLVKSCGLVNMADSLFERLFRRCKQSGWNWSYAALEKQGRMHQDILSYVSPAFYENNLGIIEGIDRLRGPLNLNAFDSLSRILIENRMIFVDTPIDQTVTHKTNQLEAKLACTIVSHWMKIYDYNGLSSHHESIGIITPFRSQIAVLKNNLGTTMRDLVSVDTVERYQGGARDHIIISLAVSKAHLLGAISNVSEEGVDRKLNVALTRARENVIIFGNKEILSKNAMYNHLIKHCYALSHLDIAKINAQ